MMRIRVLLAGLLCVLLMQPVLAQHEDAPQTPVNETYDRAVVLSVEKIPSAPGTDLGRRKDKVSGLDLPIDIGDVQKVRLRVDSGRLAGQEFTVDNILGENPAFNVPVNVGSRVIVSVDTLPDGNVQVYLADRERSPVISILFAVFMILLLWVAGRKAASHFVIATATLWMAMNVLAPAMMVWSGTSVLAALLALFFVAAAGYFLLYPACRIPYSAFVASTYACMMVLMTLMLMTQWLAPLHGFFNEGVASLWFTNPQFDYEGLLHTSAMLMGLGFVFYLVYGMAQDASESMHETMDSTVLKDVLTASGKQRLGPVLAIQWLSMSGFWLPLSIQTMDMDWMKFANLESVATVMAFVLVISLTLVLSVPLVANLMPWLLVQVRKKQAA